MTLLTAPEVARMLKVKRQTVYNLVKNYNLPAGQKLGRSRRWTLDEIKTWINERSIKSNVEA